MTVPWIQGAAARSSQHYRPKSSCVIKSITVAYNGPCSLVPSNGELLTLVICGVRGNTNPKPRDAATLGRYNLCFRVHRTRMAENFQGRKLSRFSRFQNHSLKVFSAKFCGCTYINIGPTGAIRIHESFLREILRESFLPRKFPMRCFHAFHK